MTSMGLKVRESARQVVQESGDIDAVDNCMMDLHAYGKGPPVAVHAASPECNPGDGIAFALDGVGERGEPHPRESGLIDHVIGRMRDHEWLDLARRADGRAARSVEFGECRRRLEAHESKGAVGTHDGRSDGDPIVNPDAVSADARSKCLYLVRCPQRQKYRCEKK